MQIDKNKEEQIKEKLRQGQSAPEDMMFLLGSVEMYRKLWEEKERKYKEENSLYKDIIKKLL